MLETIMSLVITWNVLNNACVVSRLQGRQSGSVPGSLVCKVYGLALVNPAY